MSIVSKLSRGYRPLFKRCELAGQIWNTISDYCPSPVNSTMNFIEQKHEKTYERIYRKPLEKILVTAWAIWTYRNKAIFRNLKVNPAQVINLVGSIFHDINYYNLVSNIFQQDANSISHHNYNRNDSSNRARLSSNKIRSKSMLMPPEDARFDPQP